MIKNWTNHLDKMYNKKLPLATRPVKELVISQHSILIRYRPTYNGGWLEAPMLQPKFKRKSWPHLNDGEFLLPERAYKGKQKTSIILLFFHRSLFLQSYCQ